MDFRLGVDVNTVLMLCFLNMVLNLGPSWGIQGSRMLGLVVVAVLLALVGDIVSVGIFYRCSGSTKPFTIFSKFDRAWPFSVKTSMRNSISSWRWLGEHRRCALTRKPLNTPETIYGLMLMCGLIWTLVIASLRYTLKSYTPLPLLCMLTSRKGSVLFSSSYSMVYWIIWSC